MWGMQVISIFSLELGRVFDEFFRDKAGTCIRDLLMKETRQSGEVRAGETMSLARARGCVLQGLLGSLLMLCGVVAYAQAPAATVQTQPVAHGDGMPAVAGTQLDRVVAIVNGELILDSDVNEEQRFEKLQPFGGFGASQTREQTIERLINRALILQQSALQPQDAISDADVMKEIDGLRKTIPACKNSDCQTKGGWDRVLASYGFTEAVLLDRWRKRMEVLRFIEQRFRAGTVIKDDEVQNYYEKTMLPEYAKQGMTPPKLDAIEDRIREVLLQQRVSSLLSDWLKSLRVQGGVVVLHPGEEAP